MYLKKRIAMAAHFNRQDEMVNWAGKHYSILLKHQIIGIGPIGNLLEMMLLPKSTCLQMLSIQKLKSGPEGCGKQICGLMAEKKIDVLIFFWDPAQSDPNDVDDVLRMSVLNDICTACNRSTADMIVSSPVMRISGTPIVISDYRRRAAINFTY